MVLIREEIVGEIKGARVRIAAWRRPGKLAPILFLHGFGGVKEDYADFARLPMFEGRDGVAFDAPGFGESHCGDVGGLSIPFLSDVAWFVLQRCDLPRVHLVGHSMGGLTALVLANAHPEAVLSFTNIEGNLAPEDCFYSRQVLERKKHQKDGDFLNDFVERTWRSPALASSLFASSVRARIGRGSATPILESIVRLSDSGVLLGDFMRLSCPKMFVHGDENGGLSYIPALRSGGVAIAEIPRCGHFPLYSNPPAFWDSLQAFIASVEEGRA